MPLPPSFAASPPPISAIVETYGLRWTNNNLALIAICFLIILYLILLNFFKSELESGSEPAGALPVVREPEIVRVEASVFSYKEADGGHDDECAICLDEFEDAQKCRKMNNCGHIFHRRCIDRWLKVDRHCPLCRSCVCVVVHP